MVLTRGIVIFIADFLEKVKKKESKKTATKKHVSCAITKTYPRHAISPITTGTSCTSGFSQKQVVSFLLGV